MDAKTLGLKIYTAETTGFLEKVTFEDIVEGLKRGRYKMTYIEKKTNNEIISMLIKRMIKITQDELKMVPDDVFRKIRQGREHTPPSKPTKKYGRSKYTKRTST